MKFFLPQTTKSKQEASYVAIVDSIKSQLRWPITEKRIYSLDYTHDKKPHRAEVGKPDQMNHRNEVLAIFESNVYIVYTRSKTGHTDLTVLVDKNEVEAVEEFDVR